MACTSQPLATQVALDILKAGGNAMDAAIAANAVLGLVEHTGNGVGGYLFAIVWDAETEKLYGLNASGRSPRSLTVDYFKENGIENIPSYGHLPVSVPGCVDGWYELNEKFGSMKMEGSSTWNRGYPIRVSGNWSARAIGFNIPLVDMVDTRPFFGMKKKEFISEHQSQEKMGRQPGIELRLRIKAVSKVLF